MACYLTIDNSAGDTSPEPGTGDCRRKNHAFYGKRVYRVQSVEKVSREQKKEALKKEGFAVGIS